jgi:hypothetical protein
MEKPQGDLFGASPVPGGEPVTEQGNTVTDKEVGVGLSFSSLGASAFAAKAIRTVLVVTVVQTVLWIGFEGWDSAVDSYPQGSGRGLRFNPLWRRIRPAPFA